MTGYFCNCGLHLRTLAGLRKHATKCAHASAKLRRAEDRARVDRVEHAKKVNDAAREDTLEQP
jgi:hypothetical protein